MKKTTGMKLIAIAILAATAGCQIFSSDPSRPGYQEGRTAAFAYVMTESIQPEEVNSVIKAGYQMIDSVFSESGESPIDAVVRAQIETTYHDSTPEFQAFVFNFYKMGVSRVTSEAALHPDIPSPVVIGNFLAGVKDSLRDWKGLETDLPGADQ